ncbi:MAG TPA: TIGR04283 family arsenosugar biosynthesis glycosyltransferase [Thermoanaerobaculia bacterium]
MPVSVVIPTLNEEEWIVRTIESAFAAGASEVIVADGGSGDRTLVLAETTGARLVPAARGRGQQLNRGAAAAAHEFLIFLHADTLLPAGAIAAVESALASNASFGGFRVRFFEGGWRLRYVAFMINMRTRLTRAPWGDQAQFARRDAFVASGGYPDVPIMEDYEFALRMKRATSPALLPLEVTTSGRRFLARGVIRTSILNWIVIGAWHLGVSPDRLAAWYRR